VQAAANDAEKIDLSDVVRSAGDGPWSDPTTWEGDRMPGQGDTVLIQEGHVVTFDVDSEEVTRSIHVSEESARINFREDALPRMALLRDAFHDRQIDVDVRRTRPLSLVLKQGGVRPVLAKLVEALSVLATTEEAGAAA